MPGKIQARESEHRNWMFTSFKDEAPFFTSKMWYQIYQREICPTTKKEHWQGYVECSYPMTLQTIKNHLGDKACHLEPRKGTQQQAIDYCSKDDTRKPGTKPITNGISKNQGSRSDLNSIVEAIESGATKKELLKEFKGNAFRHLGMIDRAQRAIHGWDDIDNKIESRRSLAKDLNVNIPFFKKKDVECPNITTPRSPLSTTEVTGNTAGVVKKYIIWSDNDDDNDSSDSSNVSEYTGKYLRKYFDGA